jgi:tRNA (cytidine/uridine-2'-O-)-methyltransferase
VFHIVLFEPEIPGNAGNCIRLCANSGATLHLIKPLGFRLDDRSLKRSGLDYHDLADVKVHASLDACIAALNAARLFVVETAGTRCYGDVQYREGDAFLFGPETRGLPQAALELVGAERRLVIPMRAANRSINLSNAVALIVFEAWRQTGFVGSEISRSTQENRLR